MKIAKNEKCGVVEFLESAEAATLEERRLHRRLEALETRCDGLRVRGGRHSRRCCDTTRTRRTGWLVRCREVRKRE